MDLKVKFWSENGFAANVERGEVGLALVDKVRDAECVPGLPLSRFRDEVYSLYGTHYVTVDEPTARRSGHFENCNRVTVVVPEKYLNKFATISHKVTKNRSTGEIEEVKFSYVINDEELIKHWESLGFPLEIQE